MICFNNKYLHMIGGEENARDTSRAFRVFTNEN